MQVPGVKDPSQYMYVACPNNKCWLGPYPKEKWGEQPIKRCNCRIAEGDPGLPFFQPVPLTIDRVEWEPTGRVSTVFRLISMMHDGTPTLRLFMHCALLAGVGAAWL
jgi:hypothetical protein